MAFYADLHVHSRYSRATAKSCDLEHLAFWGRKKGIAVLGTGDFTHPGWRQELGEQLVPAEAGLFRLRPELEAKVIGDLPGACQGPVRFMLSVEISTIYKKGDRTRKVHHVVYAPDLESADRFTEKLSHVGNLKSDGRPILGLDSRDLLEMVLESGEGNYLVPAHIWTPWFSAMGSKSGFDSIDECYADLAPHIFAVETGLSSDPEMNWRVASLDRFRLVSNSDAHSPPALGREANIFDSAQDYFGIRTALETGVGYVGTVEFYPEEGKYHLDGHRKCGVCLTPAETAAHGGKCPVCGKPVTVGVMNRVQELADRDEGAPPPATGGAVSSLVPLPEMLSELYGVGPKSKKVTRIYEGLVSRLGPELEILSSLPLEDVRRGGSSLLAEAVERLRRGQVIRQGGFDGEFGVIRMFGEQELASLTGGGLFPMPGPAEVKASPSVPPPTPEPEPASPPRPPVAEAPPETSVSEVPDGPLEALDEHQRAAAQIVEGPLLIVAGPGSGKTRTLTHRIAHLVRDRAVDPASCLTITFTRRAAQELSERLEVLLPGDGPRVPVFTFHGLVLHILQESPASAGLEPGFRIAGEGERLQLLQETLGLTAARARHLLGTLCGDEMAAYKGALRERNWLDFDDLVGLAVVALEGDGKLRDTLRQRYRHLSVDEYQDVDARQVRLLELLASAGESSGGSLCAIGDPDQAIYGFRGADVRLFGRFGEDFPGTRIRRLARNYRSGGGIVEGSAQVVAALDGTERAVEAMLPAADRIVIHQAPSGPSEAEFVVKTIERMIGGHSFFSVDSGRAGEHRQADLSFSDFAVLVRTDALADAADEALTRSGMPFQRRSHAPMAGLPGVRSILDRLAGESDGGTLVQRIEAAATALADQPPEEITAAQVRAAAGQLVPLAARCRGEIEQLEAEVTLATQVDTWDSRADRVSLLTLHSSKGLEFRVVFILGCEEGILPLAFGDGDPEDVDEERRLLYVGMTRAEELLLLCHARKRPWRGRTRDAVPSRFLGDIAEALLERRSAGPRPRGGARDSGQLDLF